MPDVSYVPGPMIAVAGDHCLALVEATPDSAAATWMWQRVGLGTSAEAVLARLLGSGFDGVGGFALLADDPAGRRLFCRGAISATVQGNNVLARIDGIGLTTWREYVVATDADRVVLGQPPDGGKLRLPAAPGVLLASCVIIDLTGAASRDTVRPDSRGGGDHGEHDLVRDPEKTRTFEEASIISRPPPPSRSPESASSRSRLPEPVPPPEPVPALPRPLSPGGLIDAVQWGSAPTVAAEPPSHQTTAPATGATLQAAGRGESEHTVRRPGPSGPGEAERTAGLPTPPGWIIPTVAALLCPAGHVNPPSAADCRHCGAPLPHDAVVAPRPVLGRLLLSTGEAVALDRGVVMGRDPRTDFPGVAGEARPHVVRLPSAGGDISRTHLRVTLDGWHVLVTDLDSTNGTLVALPGRDPEQLRPGEPVPIKPGTVVTLADGIDFRYEVDE
jgi:FHA domain